MSFVLVLRRESREKKKKKMESAGEWLEKALVELCSKIETGLELGLDEEIIKGLVSYCNLAEPRDAKEYLDVTLDSFHSLFLIVFLSISVDLG